MGSREPIQEEINRIVAEMQQRSAVFSNLPNSLLSSSSSETREREERARYTYYEAAKFNAINQYSAEISQALLGPPKGEFLPSTPISGKQACPLLFRLLSELCVDSSSPTSQRFSAKSLLGI